MRFLFVVVYLFVCLFLTGNPATTESLYSAKYMMTLMTFLHDSARTKHSRCRGFLDMRLLVAHSGSRVFVLSEGQDTYLATLVREDSCSNPDFFSIQSPMVLIFNHATAGKEHQPFRADSRAYLSLIDVFSKFDP